MYRNIVLTLLLVVAVVIAIELARPPKPPAAPVEAPLSDANRAVLERRIPELKLHGITVLQAIEVIRRKTGIPIAVNWTSLGEIRDHVIDIELHDVAIGDVLQFLFRLDNYDLAFYPFQQTEFDVVNGTLFIGNAVPIAGPTTFPAGAMTLQSYDVRDLLTDAYWGYQSSGTLPTQGQSRLDVLASFVQTFAGMKNWQWQIGSHGREPQGYASISCFAGRLIVVQTAYGHMQVEAFLSQLRAAGHPSINMSN